VRRLLLALVAVVAVVAGGCRGIASSRGDTTPQASTSSTKVVIDRDCSKLGDSSDEYVCLRNEDSGAVDMGSWVLRNVLGRSFNFPPGFTLAPGQTVRVHTGAGADSATDLHWAYSVNPAWETADKLTLHNKDNLEVFISEPKR
jgi:hypothetical protein